MTSTRLHRAVAPVISIAAATAIVFSLAGWDSHSAAAATTARTVRTPAVMAFTAASLPHVPIYKPSTVISSGPRSRQLRSRSAVAKVAAFYKKALSKNGWHRQYSSSSRFNASFGARRVHEGLSVSIFARQGGSGISIATHPV